MRKLAATMLCLALVGGCEDDPAPEFRVEIVTRSGDDPVGDANRLRLRIRQGLEPVEELDVTIAGGFDVSTPITDTLALAQIAVRLDGPSGTLIGGAPSFTIAESGGLVRLPVAPPSTCGVLEGVTIGEAASAVGVSAHGTFALVIGGDAATGASAQAGFLDLLQLRADALDPLDAPLGAARSRQLTTDRALVLGADRTLVYVLGPLEEGEQPEQPPPLHADATAGSTALRLSQGSLVVAGGGSAAAPSARYTFIPGDPMQPTRILDLLTPRHRPAVGAIGSSRALVVGGDDGTGPWAELLIEGVDDNQDLGLAPLGERRSGAALLWSEDGARLLLIGGTDSMGVVSDTVLFSGCPTACTVEPGPPWTGARAGATVVAVPGGGGLLVGGDGPVATVDRVVFDDAGVRIEPFGALEVPRADPGVFALDNGIVYVVGGEGTEGVRADVELCTPEVIRNP